MWSFEFGILGAEIVEPKVYLDIVTKTPYLFIKVANIDKDIITIRPEISSNLNYNKIYYVDLRIDKLRSVEVTSTSLFAELSCSTDCSNLSQYSAHHSYQLFLPRIFIFNHFLCIYQFFTNLTLLTSLS